jgi:hypothetical protein
VVQVHQVLQVTGRFRNSSGTSGIDGSSGTSGATGAAGSSGTSGAGTSGTSGTSGAGASLTLTDGSNTVANVAQITVSGGTVGGTSPNATLTISGGGGGGISTVYNNTNRYVYTSGDDQIQIVSSGTLYAGLTWSRSTTTLTVTSTAHGLTTGDYVLIRNMSADYQYLPITVSDSNTFTVTVADSGGASGTEGAYVPCIKMTALSESAITFVAPSAGNVQLISCVIYLDAPESSPTITVPSNALSNGAGINNSLATKNPPVLQVYRGDTGILYTGAGYTFSTVSNFNIINTANFDIFAPLLARMVF